MNKGKVAVINSSKEITELLIELFSEEGYATCSSFTYLFKGNERRFEEFIKEQKPDVIVYDIAVPYEENFNLFISLSSKKIAKSTPFVLTSTNKEALESMVGKTPVHELIGKPFDLQEIIDALAAAYAKIPPPAIPS